MPLNFAARIEELRAEAARLRADALQKNRMADRLEGGAIELDFQMQRSMLEEEAAAQSALPDGDSRADHASHLVWLSDPDDAVESQETTADAAMPDA